jgi:hypothetical protein
MTPAHTACAKLDSVAKRKSANGDSYRVFLHVSPLRDGISRDLNCSGGFPFVSTRYATPMRCVPSRELPKRLLFRRIAIETPWSTFNEWITSELAKGLDAERT